MIFIQCLVYMSLFWCCLVCSHAQDASSEPDKEISFLTSDQRIPLMVPDSAPLFPPTSCYMQDEQSYALPTFLQNLPVPLWLMEHSIAQAPLLIKGIVRYLSHTYRFVPTSSYHRLLLVGQPGTGKTTLAYALANLLQGRVWYIKASSLLGDRRNQAVMNVRNCLEELKNSGETSLLIIDEIHKLFEYHTSENTDGSATAAAFWLELDEIEKQYPNIFIIGTANNVQGLPPELVSRFRGRIITLTKPTPIQRIEGFKNIVSNDISIRLDSSVTDRFIASLLTRIQDCSFRDIQSLINTAKMFRYAEGSPIHSLKLTRTHFERAVAQFKEEESITKENLLEAYYPTLKRVGLVLAITINCCVLLQAGKGCIQWIADACN